jgi:hypothetical protein
MHAAAAGKGRGTGITRKVAQEYVREDKGGKLPKRVRGTKGKGKR